MAFLPPIIIVLGLLTLLVVAGHTLMKPAVYRNPGLAAYKPPTAAVVLDYGRGEGAVETERAARQVAEAENAKPENRQALLAQARAIDGLDRLAVTAPQQKGASTARVERRTDAAWPSGPRVARSEPASFTQRWIGSF